MNPAITATVLIAACTGIGVYLSCTAHRNILGFALTIDAIGIVVMTWTMWMMGIYGQ